MLQWDYLEVSITCPIAEWERVLPDALHSTRSLLCTATNATLHERLFNFQRQSGNQTIPLFYHG